jgi:hypothetical protein
VTGRDLRSRKQTLVTAAGSANVGPLQDALCPAPHATGSEVLQPTRKPLGGAAARWKRTHLTAKLDHVPEDLVARESPIPDLTAIHPERLQRSSCGGKRR